MWTKRIRSNVALALAWVFVLALSAGTWFGYVGASLLYAGACVVVAFIAIVAAVKVSPARGIPAHVPVDDPSKIAPPD